MAWSLLFWIKRRFRYLRCAVLGHDFNTAIQQNQEGFYWQLICSRCGKKTGEKIAH